MSYLIKEPLAFRKNRTPYFSLIARYHELVCKEPDYRFYRNAHCWKVDPFKGNSRREASRLGQSASKLEMSPRMRLRWYAEVIVSEDPASTFLIDLVLVDRFLHLESAACSGFREKKCDRDFEEASIVEWQRIFRTPPAAEDAGVCPRA